MNPDDVSLLFRYMQRLAAPAVYSVLQRGAVRFGWAASTRWAALPAANRQISIGPDSSIYHSRKVHAVKQEAEQHNATYARWYREAPKQPEHCDGR
jgi:hypothetical protein